MAITSWPLVNAIPGSSNPSLGSYPVKLKVTSWPLVNRLSGTGAVSTLGTFPVVLASFPLPATVVVNRYGVTLSSSAAARPTLGQVYPLGTH